jgi:hypothetical protein
VSPLCNLSSIYNALCYKFNDCVTKILKYSRIRLGCSAAKSLQLGLSELFLNLYNDGDECVLPVLYFGGVVFDS